MFYLEHRGRLPSDDFPYPSTVGLLLFLEYSEVLLLSAAGAILNFIVQWPSRYLKFEAKVPSKRPWLLVTCVVEIDSMSRKTVQQRFTKFNNGILEQEVSVRHPRSFRTTKRGFWENTVCNLKEGELWSCMFIKRHFNPMGFTKKIQVWVPVKLNKGTGKHGFCFS